VITECWSMGRTQDLSERYLEFNGSATPVNIVKWGKKILKEGGVEDFTVSAEQLLAHILNKNRSEILIDISSEINKKDIEYYKRNISRRLTREPLQYIVGLTEFYNVTIKCDKRALIPRPETEILCETVIDIFKDEKPTRILDIGTGSGAIALALWKNIIKLNIVATDISSEALDLAAENAVLNEAGVEIEFIHGDIYDNIFVSSLGKYDCIVSNPPYVSENEKDILQPEVIEHEPHLALFSPGDSLAFYRRIIKISDSLLNSGGLLAFETGYEQAAKVSDMMRTGFDKIKIIKDLTGISRVVTGIFAGK